MLASELPVWIVRVLAFVFGATWGSFFNVAIYRWPREMSVVSPRSHCPACGKAIPGWRNVPLVSWLTQRGRAACCGAPISSRYFFVELLTALLCVAVAERYVVHAAEGALLADAAIEAALYFVFVGALIIATFVDLEWMEIPDEVSIPGAALGLATVQLRAEPSAVSAAIGAGLGYLAVQVLFVWVYERLTGRRGMGEGDSKLLMLIGAFLGWPGALFALVAGNAQGLVVAIVALVSGRGITPKRPDAPDPPEETSDAEVDAAPRHIGHLKMPLGPFLSLAALEFLFFGDWITAQYVALVTIGEP